MPTRVRFRFNRVTGEVEEFLVDDQDQNLSEAEHDRVASEVAAMVAVHPRITPVEDANAWDNSRANAQDQAQNQDQTQAQPDAESNASDHDDDEVGTLSE